MTEVISRSGGALTVQDLRAEDEAAWRALWAEYCAFYQSPVSEDVTVKLWQRLFTEGDVVRGMAAVDGDGTVLGFAHYVLHPHTWSEKTLCYLEDLYVSPSARGRGVGHSFIEHLIERGKESGWGRIYWHTQSDNVTARRLYDRFNPADDFVRYTVNL